MLCASRITEAGGAKALQQPTELGGSAAKLDEVVGAVEACILVRNGVAHHVLPEQPRRTDIRSDSGKHRSAADQGLTVNASPARSFLAGYAQLVDQLMAAALQDAGLQEKPPRPSCSWIGDSPTG